MIIASTLSHKPGSTALLLLISLKAASTWLHASIVLRLASPRVRQYALYKPPITPEAGVARGYLRTIGALSASVFTEPEGR
jgi:hypothetical protein